MGTKRKWYRVVEVEVEQRDQDFLVYDPNMQERKIKMTSVQFERFSQGLLPCIWTPAGEVSTMLAAALRMEPKPDGQLWAICYTEIERKDRDGEVQHAQSSSSVSAGGAGDTSGAGLRDKV